MRADSCRSPRDSVHMPQSCVHLQLLSKASCNRPRTSNGLVVRFSKPSLLPIMAPVRPSSTSIPDDSTTGPTRRRECWLPLHLVFRDRQQVLPPRQKDHSMPSSRLSNVYPRGMRRHSHEAMRCRRSSRSSNNHLPALRPMLRLRLH